MGFGGRATAVSRDDGEGDGPIRGWGKGALRRNRCCAGKSLLEYSMSAIRSIRTAVCTARRFSPKEYYRNILRYILHTYGL